MLTLILNEVPHRAFCSSFSRIICKHSTKFSVQFAAFSCSVCVAFVLDPQVEEDKTRFVVCILKKCLFFKRMLCYFFSSLHNYYANRAPTFI